MSGYLSIVVWRQKDDSQLRVPPVLVKSAPFVAIVPVLYPVLTQRNDRRDTRTGTHAHRQSDPHVSASAESHAFDHREVL